MLTPQERPSSNASVVVSRSDSSGFVGESVMAVFGCTREPPVLSGGGLGGVRGKVEKMHPGRYQIT